MSLVSRKFINSIPIPRRSTFTRSRIIRSISCSVDVTDTALSHDGESHFTAPNGIDSYTMRSWKIDRRTMEYTEFGSSEMGLRSAFSMGSGQCSKISAQVVTPAQF
jgi:hypothetical protein